MGKEKFTIEYVFDKASKNSLWNHLTTTSGLSEWFADEVSINENIFIFNWNKEEVEAEQVAISPFSFVRFKWLDDDDPISYFEFRLQTMELTGSILLEVIDFASASEKEDSISLWDSQIKVLKRTLGI